MDLDGGFLAVPSLKLIPVRGANGGVFVRRLQGHGSNLARRGSIYDVRKSSKITMESIFERQEVSKRYLYSEERSRRNYDRINRRHIPNPNKAQKRILDEGFSNHRKTNLTYGDAAAIASGLGAGGYMMYAGNKMMKSPFAKPSKGQMRNLKVAAAVGIPAAIWNARGTARDFKGAKEWDRNLERAREAGKR